MSLVERHLNFNNNNLQGFLSNLDNSIQIDSLYEYQELYKKYQTNSDEVFEIIKLKFYDYIKKKYGKNIYSKC